MIEYQFRQPSSNYEVAFVRTGSSNWGSYLFVSTSELLPTVRLTVYVVESTHVFLLGNVADELSRLIGDHTNSELAALLDNINPRVLTALRRELGISLPNAQAHGGRRAGAGRPPKQ